MNFKCAAIYITNLLRVYLHIYKSEPIQYITYNMLAGQDRVGDKSLNNDK